ncbi:hypothetical protein BU183_06085 [Enterococcus faecium]|nr:hypothetical protein BU183_06085 [Enterococcus faecium]
MILDESGFTAGMNNAVKKLNSFDETIERKSRNSGSSLGSIWKIFAGSFLASGVTRIVGAGFDLIKGSISGAVDRVDTMNNALRNFQNMGFSNSEIMKNIGKNGLLSQGIQGLPTALNDAISHVQLLASSTGDLTRSTQIFKALNDGILGFGGSTDQVNEAVIQLSQSFSNGKVDAQTWNSMINAQLGPTLSAIAKKMGISTQPIYLEFKNMEDLKNTLLDSIFEQLKEDVFPIERTGDKIIDLGLNYIYFAKKHHSLYMALYIDEHGDGKKMHDFSYNYFREIVKEDERYNQLSDEYVDALHTGTWVAVTGLASLMSSNIMHPTEEQIIALIKRTIDSILALDNPEIIR